jgi:CDGSH-type Zn-finger protein
MTRATEIACYPDGPLIVRGPVRLVDATGTRIPTRRTTIALCRCGHSRIKPFCDGTHRTTGFATQEEDGRPGTARAGHHAPEPSCAEEAG